MPKLGLTAEEVAERKHQALAWSLEMGAAQTVLKAYGRARQSGDAERTASNASCEGSKVDGQAEWRGGKTPYAPCSTGHVKMLGRLLFQGRVHDGGVVGCWLLHCQRVIERTGAARSMASDRRVISGPA